MKLNPIKGKGCENLFRHPESQIIYLRVSRKGKGRIEWSTGTTVLSQAKITADEYRLEFFGEGTIKRGRKLCGELFPEFIDQKRIKSPATVYSIENSWKHLEPYIGRMLPEEIDEKWWEAVYIPQKRRETTQDRKFFNDRKWLAMFLLSLKRLGVIKKTPELINPDPERAAGKVFTDEEVAALLANADADLSLQILMAVTMGMRKGEIMGLSWDRIDMRKRTITLRAEDTKIRKARKFGISDVVYERLKERAGKGQVWLFPSPVDPTQRQRSDGNKSAWETCRDRSGVTGRFHDLRHTFLTVAFKTSTNPALICHYAGLSLEEAQRTYLHLTEEDTRQVANLMGVEI